MNMYRKLFLFVLFCCFISTSVLQGQTNGCGLEIINTEFLLESENEITIRVNLQSNNIQGEGVAYLINNIDLQSLGNDIFWSPALFSVHSNDLTFQIAISGTSVSAISIADDLIVNGRIVLSFDEFPISSHDTGFENFEIDTILVSTVDSEFDEEEIVDTSIVVLDSAIIPIDTLLTEIDTAIIEIDTLNAEVDTLNIINNSDVEFDDITTSLTSDSILIGYEVFLLADFPNLCELSYVCGLPEANESDAVINEVRISSDAKIEKIKNKVPESFGSIFDDELLEMGELSFNVFPNPTIEYFYIHSDTDENLNVLIYTTTGNIVFEKTMDSNYTKVNTRNLPDGLYFVLLKSNLLVK